MSGVRAARWRSTHPDFEGKDVSAIISWVATQPEVQLDDPDTLDPRIGMVGASYGGGIQLVDRRHRPPNRRDRADHRVAQPQHGAVQGRGVQEQLGHLARRRADRHQRPRESAHLPRPDLRRPDRHASPDDQDLLDERGPDELVGQITAPTLLIQGTVDTLFTLQEADANAKALDRQRCSDQGGVVLRRPRRLHLHPQRRRDGQAGDAGLARPLREGRLDRGHRSAVRMGRPARDTVLVEHLSGPSRARRSSRPAPKAVCCRYFRSSAARDQNSGLLTAGPIGALLGIPSGSKAINALNLTIPQATTTTYIVGAPQLTLTYSGTGTSRHVYAQFVDDTTGLVLGNLVTPIPVTLDGQTHTVSVPMEMVAQTLRTRRVGDAAAGRVRVPVRDDHFAGRAECVEHDAVVADGECGGDLGVVVGGGCHRRIGRRPAV